MPVHIISSHELLSSVISFLYVLTCHRQQIGQVEAAIHSHRCFFISFLQEHDRFRKLHWWSDRDLDLLLAWVLILSALAYRPGESDSVLHGVLTWFHDALW